MPEIIIATTNGTIPSDLKNILDEIAREKKLLATFHEFQNMLTGYVFIDAGAVDADIETSFSVAQFTLFLRMMDDDKEKVELIEYLLNDWKGFVNDVINGDFHYINMIHTVWDAYCEYINHSETEN